MMGHSDVQIFFQKLIQFGIAIRNGHSEGLAIFGMAADLSGIVIIDNVHIRDLSGLDTFDQFIVMGTIDRFWYILLLHAPAEAEDGQCKQHDQAVDRQIF